MDYYLPMPMYQNRLESTGVWGVKNVVPRDIYNGIEDSSCKKYSYWDGAIIKAKQDGKYHMYCSRWDQSAGHGGWWSSVAVHAVSDSIMGPYIDKGLAYTYNGGKGHNVTAIELPDGRYAILVCETVPASIFISSDPNGPFQYQGHLQINTNGHNTSGVNLESNMSICMREDSTFLIVTRDGFVMHSTSGIMGPYLVKTDKIWPMNLPGYNTANWEDPVIWRSGKKYYCTVNCWSSKKAIYLTSDDGITNWKYGGEAYSPMSANLLRYTNGKVNKWCKMERPGVFLVDGIVTHLTFAVIDTEKEVDLGNDNHNSKVIVVPFDGAAFSGITPIQSYETQTDRKRTVSLTIKMPGKSINQILIDTYGSIEGATRLDIEIYSVNGRLVTRFNNVPVSNNRCVLNYNSGAKLNPGMYLISVRYGKHCFQGRLTVQ